MTDAEAVAGPVSTVGDAITRMVQIEGALPASDGVACFNRMYLDVTEQVEEHLTQDFFLDPAFMETLDVTFANRFFAAVEAAEAAGGEVPPAWRPLFVARSDAGIMSIQFALAGMVTHIGYDLPIAVVDTCRSRGSALDGGSVHADYQKVDGILDSVEQGVRQSFESGGILRADRMVERVLDLAADWSLRAARDVAWDTAVALWHCRDAAAAGVLEAGLAQTVAAASQALLARQ